MYMTYTQALNSEQYNVTDLSWWWIISDKMELPQPKYTIIDQ